MVQPKKDDLDHSPLFDNNSTNFSGYTSETEKDSSENIEVEEEFNSLRCKAIEVNGIILRDYMSSDNLNECVSALLRKEKITLKSCTTKVIRYNPTGKEKEKRKRQRKNRNQFAFL